MKRVLASSECQDGDCPTFWVDDTSGEVTVRGYLPGSTTEEGDVTIIPVVEERAVLVTRLFVVEEIHIRRTRVTETVEVPVTLRRQRAVVEQLEPGAAESGPGEG